MKSAAAAAVRSAFLEYFVERGHTARPSSSLVPADDPTLIFTNAGMVQFKGIFLGEEKVAFDRAVTSQRCVRAGGKHNDLEEVGRTARHHTFFEMLGNFSFGDYFKREAVGYAWELVTEVYGLDPDRLYATVHHTDDEAADYWSSQAGIPPERVHRLGDKDNFWQMADTGPCGPCSELHYDLRGSSAPPPSSTEEFVTLNDAGTILELWNLVFMQYDRSRTGELAPLPAQSVDTGAGLERFAAVLQGADSNFHTDLFAPLLARISDLVGRGYRKTDPESASFRVIADHARAVAFLLADGVVFRNEGRGYVLRRILRRAVRHAWLLGRREATLAPVVGRVVDTMAEAFPELDGRRGELVRATELEEERFLATIEGGIGRLSDLMAGSSGTISGSDAFKLYDTYGFPIDLTRIMAAEGGYGVDEAGFRVALEAQRERSRLSRASAADAVRHDWSPALDRVDSEAQSFVGYEVTEADTEVVAASLSEDRVSLILAANPFYREAGGQVSDTGVVAAGEEWKLRVDSVTDANGVSAVSGAFSGPDPATVDLVGAGVRVRVDPDRRLDIKRNHTATHLLHAALRETLGEHVAQKGSLVAPDRLRFDFSHPAPLAAEELALIEHAVNERIWAGNPVETELRPLHEARASGAMALFGEKYGEVVRVVEIRGVSIELCGGTHVANTGEIGLFRIVSESGVGAGLRRIEALTGRGAFAFLSEREAALLSVSEALRTSPANLTGRVESLIRERKELGELLAELRASGGGAREAVRKELVTGNGKAFVYAGVELPCHTPADARSWGDRFLGMIGSGIAVLAAELPGGRRSLFTFVSGDLVGEGLHAGEVVREVAALTGGRGGGRPHMAQGGVGDPDQVGDALRAGEKIVLAKLEAGAGE
ncbi:MAG: alanine--tRNA ligase [Gemmatimonadetes bacterium]|nr:alanine--tRNA ligase [Gemmatimonadota bacterium]